MHDISYWTYVIRQDDEYGDWVSPSRDVNIIEMYLHGTHSIIVHVLWCNRYVLLSYFSNKGGGGAREREMEDFTSKTNICYTFKNIANKARIVLITSSAKDDYVFFRNGYAETDF